MVSEYLKKVRSLKELRALVEKHHRASLAIAETCFNQSVTAAFSSITEVTQISSARIQADSQVASAKIASDSEIASISLIASAEITMLNIQSQRFSKNRESEHPGSMTMEICRIAKDEIVETAQKYVNEIQEHAETAISNITDTGKQSILKIQAYRSEVQKRMQSEDVLYTNRLNSAFGGESDNDNDNDMDEASYEKAADEEEEKLQEDLVKALDELDQHVENAIQNLKSVTDDAIAQMKKTVEVATERIFSIRNDAVEKIDFILTHNSTR